jgi:holo-[acyl-carrier protein] synthase
VSVVGIGLDVVDVDAFAQQLAVPGTRFAIGAFRASERADVGPIGQPGAMEPAAARRLAARFAAKEAFVKAWSSSRFGQAPAMADWAPSEVEVVGDVHGRPSLALHGEIAAAVHAQLGERWTAHLSLSHDGPVAAAMVVLEAGAEEQGDRS